MKNENLYLILDVNNLNGLSEICDKIEECIKTQ